LVGQTVAQNLFGAADPTGQVIRINKVPLTVIGVLARKGQSTQGQDQDDTVLTSAAMNAMSRLAQAIASPES
jgi:putative ABC transport system permease protein